MMDKYYKYAYELSELMLNRQEVNPYEAVQDITGEYALFCKILFIFALRVQRGGSALGQFLQNVGYMLTLIL